MELYCEEIRPYWLLATRGYGFTVKDIDNSSPSDLEPYAKAYSMEISERDSLVHAWFGAYGMSAISVVLDHCFNKQAKSKYLKNSLTSKEMIENDVSSESKEEIAVFEAKQRIKALKQQGLPESPM